MAKAQFLSINPMGSCDFLTSLMTGQGFSINGEETSCSEVTSSSVLHGGSLSPPGPVGVGATGMSSVEAFSDSDIDNNLFLDTISSSGCFSSDVGSSTPSTYTQKIFSLMLDDQSGGGTFGREDDLSPASSYGVNSGCVTPSSASGDSRKKKSGGASRQTEEECMVCGDRASGYHYSALTCEGCKGFFRRSITKHNVYKCKYGDLCEMDMYMRRKCQECRFKKCIAVGMRPECVTQKSDCISTPSPAGVVPETTCRAKREQKKTRDKPLKGPKDTPLPTLPQESHSQDGSNQIQCVYPTTDLRVKPISIEMTKDHGELISRLLWCQSQYENPKPSESCGLGEDAQFNKMTELTRITIELIVQFALSIPGFETLHQDDQVTLLKASSSELTILRASVKYHLDTDTIVFADSGPVTREFYVKFGMETESVDLLYDFCRGMALMDVDNAEYALLTGILIFCERPSLVDPSRVEKIQYLYVETLHAYVNRKWKPKTAIRIAKLLNVLTQLRPLGIMNSEQCEKLMNKNMPMPDLMLEIWDINKP